MTVRPCTDASPAEWLLHADRDWSDLAVRGPLGYEQYARLRFIPDPAYPDQRANDFVAGAHDPISEIEQLSIAVSCLTVHTTTPDDCYFAIWEGWGGLELVGAPQVPFVNREAVLYCGATTDLSTWVDSRDTSDSNNLPIPAFVWPADHAWVIANDVDPHFATIGASAMAVEELLQCQDIDVVHDDPSVPQSWYHH